MAQSPFLFNFAQPQQQQGSPMDALAQILQMRKQQGADIGGMGAQPMGGDMQPMQHAASPFGDALMKNVLDDGNQTQLSGGGNIQWNGARQGGMPDSGMDLSKLFGDSKIGQFAKLLGFL